MKTILFATSSFSTYSQILDDQKKKKVYQFIFRLLIVNERSRGSVFVELN